MGSAAAAAATPSPATPLPATADVVPTAAISPSAVVAAVPTPVRLASISVEATATSVADVSAAVPTPASDVSSCANHPTAPPLAGAALTASSAVTASAAETFMPSIEAFRFGAWFARKLSIAPLSLPLTALARLAIMPSPALHVAYNFLKPDTVSAILIAANATPSPATNPAST